jgi:anti-anti-sigma factor
MEAWIASNLELELDRYCDFGTKPASRNAWNRLIEKLPVLRRTPKPQRVADGPEASLDGWARFRIAYKPGITAVRLLDKALVKESQVRELARDLLDLIAAGNHRVILNFQAVERLASWVVVAVAEARRRCTAAEDGALKICGLQPHLADIFSIAGMAAGIPLYPDEAAAIDSPWPKSSGPRPLPVEILCALTNAADIPPLRGGGPSAADEAGDPLAAQPERIRTSPTAEPEDSVSLIVQFGGAKGRPIRVSPTRFLIGRDRNCHLRLGSIMVSKLHAAIARRDGRIFLRDLGSTNGTVLNDQPLRSKEAELHHGDRIQIGPIIATLVIENQGKGRGRVEDLVTEWIHGDIPAVPADKGDAQATDLFPTTGEATAEPEPHLKVEVIQDVLVVTPQVSELDDESTIELLRSHLLTLFGQPLPRLVVVSLEYVRHISGQTIGVLLAHHLRLDRAGGALRICQAHARIMALLHQVRLTMLVECHPTLDEAVLAAWPCLPHRSPMDD